MTKPASLAAGLILAALSGQATTQPGPATPPPPPPPPAISDKVLDHAVRQAFQCPAGGDGRVRAQRAVYALTPSSTSAERATARALVLDMVRRREAQKQCIFDLIAFVDSRNPSDADPDRAAAQFQEQALVEGWMQQAPYEVEVLAKFIDPTVQINPRDLPRQTP